MLISSVFLGTPGNYQIGPIGIHFIDDDLGLDVFSGTFGKLASFICSSRLIQVTALGYLHVLIHELGHTLSGSLCAGSLGGQITISTATCQGQSAPRSFCRIIESLAGPLAGVCWEVAKLVAAVALINLAPPVIAIPLATILAFGAVIWILGECAYALSGRGDWSVLLS